MSFYSVYIHFVWSTKHRLPFLNSLKLRTMMWTHIRENAARKGIMVDFVNGYSDHCHCLVSLAGNQTMQWVMQMIKGESSRWINELGILEEKFAWQDQFYAASVSQANLNKVREYLRIQEIHHGKKRFLDELKEFLVENNFQEFHDSFPGAEAPGN
ncbi:MAG: IS200/IS605 family transposase [Bacteroidia bacterium]|nr:IS200/IS605 family transposase [Bacteroidia bacterium]